MRRYFYVGHDGRSHGPIDASLLQSYGVSRSTLVWCDGMANWTRAGDVPELAPYFRSVPPTVPLSTPPAAPSPAPSSGSYSHHHHYHAPSRCPDNYLVWAILVTIFCFWPFGIPAIVNAAKVDKLWMLGDKEGAVQRSESARRWCWITFGFAIFCWIIAIILVACGVFVANEVEWYYYY